LSRGLGDEVVFGGVLESWVGCIVKNKASKMKEGKFVRYFADQMAVSY